MPPVLTKRLKKWIGSWIPHLDLFILRAFWMPWGFAFGAFTAISFSIGTLFDVLRRLTEGELSGIHALQVLVLQLPRFMVLALPMSMLLAPLLTYSQLAKSNELMALQTCGTSLYRMIRPAFCFSLVVVVATFAMNEWMVPTAALAANRLLARHPVSEMVSIPAQHILHRTYRHQHLTQLFYARAFDGEALHQLTILQYQNQKLHQIWLAQRAAWDISQQQWTLVQGTHYTINPATNLYQQIMSFQQQPIQAASPQELAATSHPTLSIQETYTLLLQMQQSGDQQYLQGLKVRWHSQMAFPWISMGFTLIGSTLGCQSAQKQASLGFGLSSLFIFAYYTYTLICQTLGDIGLLPARLAGWLPLVSLMAIGTGLLYQANTHSAAS